MNVLSRSRPTIRRGSRIAALLALALPLHFAGCNVDEEPADDLTTDSVPTTDVEADTVPQPNIVAITLQNDTPAVDIPSVCGRQGARVHWRWADTTSIQSWLVRFKDGSPFIRGDTLIESRPDAPGSPNGAQISPNAPLDSVYAYVVQVVTEDGDTLGRDPDIVIKDIKFMSASGNCQDSY